MMDNMDDPENPAKVSDSAYSNSCSNSQSRRSGSSKSTHSGSHSSGSSGYGGKLTKSNRSSSFTQCQTTERHTKEIHQDYQTTKTKKPLEIQVDIPEEETTLPAEPEVVDEPPVKIQKINEDVTPQAPVEMPQSETQLEAVSMEPATPELNLNQEEVNSSHLLAQLVHTITTQPGTSSGDGFWCIISIQDGVVMYATQSITDELEYPKNMWIGRSFIDFVHPWDRSKFASQITSGLAAPTLNKDLLPKTEVRTKNDDDMFCRIRRYRCLSSGFSVKSRPVSYKTFQLKLSLRNVNKDSAKNIYLVIQALPFYSYFSTPYQPIVRSVPFILRHKANGIIEHVSSEAVKYIGYLPQDLLERDALQMYHPDDMHDLKQVYEIIVKEGGMPRCRPFRIRTQNGDYIKVTTEWSSFTNPWSKKLEFVIGKHFVIEGPRNPDVFSNPDLTKIPKHSEEQRLSANSLRINIIQTMSETLTKPAELAKANLSKRCQYLASYMDNIMGEKPKQEDTPLELTEPEHTYYERDSLVMGGISPHYEPKDDQMSIKTTLSYNQLNYNDNLRRYFDSYDPASMYTLRSDDESSQHDNSDSSLPINMDVNASPATSPIPSPNPRPGTSKEEAQEHVFEAQGSNYQKLTESLIIKHNTAMERELLDKHRETRGNKKSEREMSIKRNRMKKEHLARCNAPFEETGVPIVDDPESSAYSHGVKRSNKELMGGLSKHHCYSARQLRKHPSCTYSSVRDEHDNRVSATNTNSKRGMHPDPRHAHPIPMMNPIPSVYPFFYLSPSMTPNAAGPSTSTSMNAGNAAQMPLAPPLQYMMYPQPVFGAPFMYSTMPPQMSLPMPQALLQQSTYHFNPRAMPGMSGHPYEAVNSSEMIPPIEPADHEHDMSNSQRISSKGGSRNRSEEDSSNNFEDGSLWPHHTSHHSRGMGSMHYGSSESTRTMFHSLRQQKMRKMSRNKEYTSERTDESSYSSFYSSFVKTESGSAEENGGDSKHKSINSQWSSDERRQNNFNRNDFHRVKKTTKRKMDPPWMEQVCVTSELVYKYQVMSRNVNEVLVADKEKMSTLKQPSLVNEQLGQLYSDLQLEGVAARLTLEEGITSSGSSGEENTFKNLLNPAAKPANRSVVRRKREYGKMAMIYEEDAQMPSPDEDVSN